MGKAGTAYKKLSKHMDKIGGILGFATGSPSGWMDVQSSFENIMAGNIHPPNMGTVVSSSLAEGFVTGGIMAALAGWGLQMIAINPWLTKTGTIVKKLGTGFAAGSFIQKVLYESTHSGAPFNKNAVGGRGTQPAATTSGRIPTPVDGFTTVLPTRARWAKPGN